MLATWTMELEGPALPQELFDLIIDELADDLESLRSCALVSSSFYSRARVFSRIRVCTRRGDHPLGELHKVLEGSPAHAARVESLHLWDYILGRPDDRSWIEASQPSDSNVAQLSPLLVSLVRLCITILPGCIFWANISGTLRNSIQHALTLPTLTCVELEGLRDLPLTLLAHCPALRTLALKWVTFDVDAAGNWDAAGQWDWTFPVALPGCVGSPPTQLETLSLHLDTPVLDHLVRWILHPQSPLDISRLRSLTCSPRDHLAIQLLLTASAPSLQCLRIDTSSDLDRILDLREALHLHTLSLDIFPPVDEWLFEFLIFPSPQQPLALILNICTDNARLEDVQLANADRVLADFQWIMSLTVILSPISPGDTAKPERFIDMSGAFMPEMPLLVARRGRGALRVLRSS
ncbi:hypothetical protein MVEN_01091100 [Mycena venus]|uniref:Uncharacterized protein n=1 Tax=Mycena venus TaxID=2733690 RepID=A0A8H7CZM7_9AGAR|nr:hypothetical protein MVEN_01091100 [Mycena venus]